MKNSNRKFNIVYIIFVFLFLSIQLTALVLFEKSITGAERNIFYLYIVINLLLAIAYTLVLKNLIRKVFDKINDLLDRAIEFDEIEELNEETEVALIVTKITKFVRNKQKKSDQAIQSKAKYEELISDISHQTKTPISSILIFSELLVENLPSSNNEALKYAENIVEQAEKLKWLIQSLIDMSRLENGIIQYNIENHNIQELITSVLAYVYSDAEKKHIQINIKEFDNYQARFDLKWSVEAVQNVLGNSIKYSREGSQIDISVDAFQYYIKITVKDYGLGICADEIPLIYSRFYRGKNVKNEEGIGIGLYLAREIITAQGGYIVISKKENIGAKVMIYLPAV